MHSSYRGGIMMEQVTRQTESHSTEPASHTTARIVGVIFAVFEIILGFRLVFKLLGANPDNGFVNVIYSITKPVVGIFSGIFPKWSLKGQILRRPLNRRP